KASRNLPLHAGCPRWTNAGWRNVWRFSSPECLFRRPADPTEPVSSDNSSVPTILDQIFDNRRIGERRRIAKRAKFILGDLSQNWAHDFPRAALGQSRRNLDNVGSSNRTDFLATPRDQFLAQPRRGLAARH